MKFIIIADIAKIFKNNYTFQKRISVYIYFLIIELSLTYFDKIINDGTFHENISRNRREEHSRRKTAPKITQNNNINSETTYWMCKIHVWNGIDGHAILLWMGHTFNAHIRMKSNAVRYSDDVHVQLMSDKLCYNFW